ncbi:transcriptional regulator [Herminiimonas sp. KBW02]|uniref:transcriptional regulator n=1 Tax=Herminiimonas sp. KBW02 TaxID=2153363 RepID=UPI000F58F767|nr:transcriptional regulator [Herminiimonas sp. KBW02]RQO33643.1 transcriptional regulator [Herminiimonas sp. KBW02]
MDITKFSKVAESLRKFQRAELKEFEKELGDKPVDAVYVDPLPNMAVLNTVLSSNTTFIFGRKGTGKSTIFARAQSDIREKADSLSVYLDVKSINESSQTSDVITKETKGSELANEVIQPHLIRKAFLIEIFSRLIDEIDSICRKTGIVDRFLGKTKRYDELKRELFELKERARKGVLNDAELPILQLIEREAKQRNSRQTTDENTKSVAAGVSTTDASFKGDYKSSDLEEILDDKEIYERYSAAVLRTFPYQEFITKLVVLLEELSFTSLILFFDDFSELSWIEQRLFVDVILAPLNNTSGEKIKLKIAAYPGRVYYGNIDPGKIDILNLDFYQLYKSSDVQTMESRAIDYTKRLIENRFEVFNIKSFDYFAKTNPIEEYYTLLFQVSFNVPRLMGHILHICYLDQISRGEPITLQSIRLASKKYYEQVLKAYFDRKNRFATEPFARKLDRNNQKILLQKITHEAREVKSNISTGKIGGTYFEGLTNPPVSHFTIYPSLEPMMASLELNFLVTKYHEMRDKSGDDVSVYCLNYGLCEDDRLAWGYPKGRRDDRSYFVQRCFSYNAVIHQFLAATRTIRCDDCGATYPIEDKEKIEYFNWQCKECKAGKCKEVNLSADYMKELAALNEDMKLEEVELDILEVLNSEGREMRAGEVSALIDTSHQLVGARTAKLKDSFLVEKETKNNITMNRISERAKEIYFSESE